MRATLVAVAGFASTSVSSAELDSARLAVPGVYYLDFRDGDGAAVSSAFFVDPLFTELAEVVLHTGNVRRLRQGRVFAGSLRLYYMPGGSRLFEGVDYEADCATGKISLIQEKGPEEILTADYRCLGETTGPWSLDAHHAIPGVVLTFGHVIAGDRVAVLVEDT